MNEGNARQKLAEMGINSRVNIGTVVSLYRNARQILSKTSADHARALETRVLLDKKLLKWELTVKKISKLLSGFIGMHRKSY